MYDKRGVVESTLRAMGLDHTRLPVKCNPDYRHTAPEDAEAAARAHAERMRAIMSGEAPPPLGPNQPQVQSQQPPQSSGVPPQQATKSGPTRTGQAANDQQALIPLVFKISPTPAHLGYRRAVPVSRQSARDAFLAMEYNPQKISMGDWCVWYLTLETGPEL